MLSQGVVVFIKVCYKIVIVTKVKTELLYTRIADKNH